MSTITTALHFETRGQGPHAVVFLHGFLGSGKNLASLARRLSEIRPDLTIYLPDLPGHGQSPRLLSPTIETVADEIRKFCKELQHPTRIVGHSFGGKVALLTQDTGADATTILLDIAPGSVPSTVDLNRLPELLCQAPAQFSDKLAARQWFLSQQLKPALADWLLMNLERSDGDFVWRIHREDLLKLHLQSRNVDLWPLVHPQRVHCIYGGRSQFVTSHDVQRFSELHCSVHEIPNAGHFIHVDDLETLTAHLATVLPV